MKKTYEMYEKHLDDIFNFMKENEEKLETKVRNHELFKYLCTLNASAILILYQNISPTLESIDSLLEAFVKDIKYSLLIKYAMDGQQIKEL
jgi:hypothetical protein